MSIQIKIPEPKQFTGDAKNARPWLNQLSRYFTAVGLNKSSAVDNSRMNAIGQALLAEKAAKWLDRLCH